MLGGHFEVATAQSQDEVAGFAQATGDIVVMLDADGSMDPAEISVFVGALLGGADMARGLQKSFVVFEYRRGVQAIGAMARKTCAGLYGGDAANAR